MANYIKYSTNAQTRALKMGNFWLGPVNDGKGPTSSTGYYTSLNPPSGGFTIYANKVSNGPAIFQASNESQLVSITNQLGGTSFTTSAQCLTWYVTQTDKFCVNREYEGIVTNGLILNLDAGFTPSYPTSGTSWYDISPSGNTGTLTNGPTFSSANGGSIVFDGTNDYVNVRNSPVSSFTVCSWIKLNKLNDFHGIIGQASSIWSNLSFAFRVTNDNKLNLALSNSGDSNLSFYSEIATNVTLNINTWYYVCGTFNKPDRKIYLNGFQSNSPVVVGISVFNYDLYPSTSNFIVGGYAYGNGLDYLMEGNIANLQMYNRELTPQEVLQNYNAQKGRFGL